MFVYAFTQVLRNWYNRTSPHMKDLYSLLLDAEKLGFIQRGTHDDLVRGKVWDGNYLTKCKPSLHHITVPMQYV